MNELDEFKSLLMGPKVGGSTERPWRVLEWADGISNSRGLCFWKLVREVWDTFDLIPHEEFERLFFRFCETRPAQPDLPNLIKVYRGQDLRSSVGLSWTLDREVAESFAVGHRGIRNPHPLVLETIVPLRFVAFYTDDREEQEVVLMEIPRDNFQLVKIQTSRINVEVVQ